MLRARVSTAVLKINTHFGLIRDEEKEWRGNKLFNSKKGGGMRVEAQVKQHHTRNKNTPSVP